MLKTRPVAGNSRAGTVTAPAPFVEVGVGVEATGDHPGLHRNTRPGGVGVDLFGVLMRLTRGVVDVGDARNLTATVDRPGGQAA